MTRDSDPPTGKQERERRRSVRLPVVNLVWFRTLDGLGDDPSSPIEGVSKMCDISHNGVGIIATQDLPLGKFVFVEVTSQKLDVSAIGVVVFKKALGKNLHRIGIRFSLMPPNAMITLDNFIRSNEKD